MPEGEKLCLAQLHRVQWFRCHRDVPEGKQGSEQGSAQLVESKSAALQTESGLGEPAGRHPLEVHTVPPAVPSPGDMAPRLSAGPGLQEEQ